MEAYKDRLISALLGSLTFIVFQPFEFPHGWIRYPIILAFILVCIVGVMVSELIVTFALKMPNDLTRGIKYIAHRNMYFVPINITLLTISVALFFHLVKVDSDVNYFSLENLSYLIVCLVFLSIFQRLYWKNRYNAKILTQELCEAQRINGILQERERQRNRGTVEKEMPENVTCTEDNVTSEQICISGSTKESVQMLVEDLLFVESNGNYITVHYMKDGKASKSEIRTSIKDVTEFLPQNTDIMRCHRAFIVNLSNVMSLERRNSGVELKIRGVAEKIPVSKSYVQELKQRLQNPE